MAPAISEGFCGHAARTAQIEVRMEDAWWVCALLFRTPRGRNASRVTNSEAKRKSVLRELMTGLTIGLMSYRSLITRRQVLGHWAIQ